VTTQSDFHFHNAAHSLLQSLLAPQARGFAASARTLRLRIRSVGNIRRITKTMKMVAASKLKGFETRMRASRPLSAAIAKVQEVMPKSETVPEGPTLCVTLNSDKGLCGAVNSTIVKSIRNWTKEHPEAQKNIIMIGDKGRAPLSRLFAKDISLQFTDHAKKPPSFVVASLIAEEISNAPQGEALLFYNKFKSAIAYETNISSLPSKTEVMSSLAKITETYEIEGEENATLADMYQFMLASRLFNGLLESTTCEFSARMQAMDGASKNCGALINRLTTQMNRARQASITTELCEIIAGAESLKG
jgi:F-type H+-transporting ATPase subunit gamma